MKNHFGQIAALTGASLMEIQANSNSRRTSVKNRSISNSSRDRDSIRRSTTTTTSDGPALKENAPPDRRTSHSIASPNANIATKHIISK